MATAETTAPSADHDHSRRGDRATRPADAAEIHRSLDLLLEPDQVAELRVLATPKGTVAGYFTSRDLIFRAIREGRLRSFKCGAARVITAEAVRDFMEQLEREQNVIP